MRAVVYARETCKRSPWLAPTPRAVLILLATYADRAGVCWPSHAELADVLGVHRDTVKRAIRRLDGSGVIAVDRRPRGPRGHQTNLYRFPVVDVLAAAPVAAAG